MPRCVRMVGDGEVSSEPDHDAPASGPNFPIGGDSGPMIENVQSRIA